MEWNVKKTIILSIERESLREQRDSLRVHTYRVYINNEVFIEGIYYWMEP